jgi:antirestriction protein ArdC
MSYTENTATENRDVYERVTSQIVNAIEQGVSTWRMPWHCPYKKIQKYVTREEASQLARLLRGVGKCRGT